MPRTLLIAVAALAALAPAAQAATWAEIDSRTAEDITAIEYQGPAQFWFATGAGHIFRRVGDTFVQTGSAPGVVFTDIEFQDGGPVGFAVGTNGGVLRSADSGATWAPVGAIAGGQAAVVGACNLADEPLGDVDSIRFAGNARAWLVAGGSQIFRTVDGATATDVGATPDGWQVINDNGSTCKINQDVDDLFPVPGSSAVYFVSKVLGTVLFSANALSTSATAKGAAAGGAAVTGTRRLTGDPANANRQWAVHSGGAGAAFLARTTDGWSTASPWTIANPANGSLTTPEGVDFAGGTVLAAGSAGMIAESIDGATFHLDPASASPTSDWRAVSLASPSAGAIGGAGGRLVVSANANVVPVPPGAAGPPPAASAAPSTGAPRPPATITTSAQPQLPRFGFQPRASPPVLGGAARRQGAFVVVDISGSFRVPAGVRTASACKGRVVLTVSKPSGKRRDLTDAEVRLSRKCTYAKRLRVRRTRIGARRSLRLRVAFKGNAVVGASSVTYVLPVR